MKRQQNLEKSEPINKHPLQRRHADPKGLADLYLTHAAGPEFFNLLFDVLPVRFPAQLFTFGPRSR